MGPGRVWHLKSIVGYTVLSHLYYHCTSVVLPSMWIRYRKDIKIPNILLQLYLNTLAFFTRARYAPEWVPDSHNQPVCWRCRVICFPRQIPPFQNPPGAPTSTPPSNFWLNRCLAKCIFLRAHHNKEVSARFNSWPGWDVPLFNIPGLVYMINHRS